MKRWSFGASKMLKQSAKLNIGLVSIDTVGTFLSRSNHFQQGLFRGGSNTFTPFPFFNWPSLPRTLPQRQSWPAKHGIPQVASTWSPRPSKTEHKGPWSTRTKKTHVLVFVCLLFLVLMGGKVTVVPGSTKYKNMQGWKNLWIDLVRSLSFPWF